MKNKIFLIGVVALFITLIFGCKKDNQYSCNEEVDNFVLENQQFIETLNRSQLLSYPFEYQKAIFRALSPKKKYELWKNKFDSLMMLKWTDKEFEFIKEISRELNSRIFEESYHLDSKLNENLERKFRYWVDYCSNELNWGDDRIYSLLGTLENQIEDNVLAGYQFNKYYLKNSDESGQGTCKCASGSDFCSGLIGPGGSLGHCVVGNCITSSWGCGVLWSYPCNGLCVLGPGPD